MTTLIAVGTQAVSAGALQWNIVTSPNTSTTQANILNGVSCTSVSSCMAVGYYYNGTYNQTLIEQWNGTSWSIVTSPNTSTTQTNQLEGVTCTSATSCMAVGYYYNGSHDQTLIMEWNGTSWSVLTSPDTSTTQGNQLHGVSCTSSTACMAVGYYYTGTYNQTLIEQWNGTSWSIVTSPDTSTTQNNYLEVVSCDLTSGDCMAVGHYYTGTYNQTLIEQWNGSAWSVVTSPNSSTTQNNDLYSVSCTSSTACMAVGYYYKSSLYYTLIEQWNGTSWSIVTSPNTSATQSNALYAVNCTSSSACMAVGYYYNGSYKQTLIEQWNGTSWSIVTSPNTSTTQTNYLEGVSCTSSTACMAVGYYYTGTYNQTLIEQYAMVCNGGTFTLTSPTTDSFPNMTLSGQAQSTNSTLTLVPDDETGTGAGWNITGTSTTFISSSSQTLPTTATGTTGSSVTAATGNCSLPTNSIGNTPLPAGSTAPTAVPLYNAALSTGEGPSNVSLTFHLAIPAGALPGTYTSTWTFTIVSGP